jgi:hypothetical protein
LEFLSHDGIDRQVRRNAEAYDAVQRRPTASELKGVQATYGICLVWEGNVE